MSESTKHDIIYLQVCEDEESEGLGKVTWCQDRINNDDVKYIRADLVKQQLADSQKQIVMLRKGFTDILTDTCEKFPGQRMVQIMGICSEALAATAPKGNGNEQNMYRT